MAYDIPSISDLEAIQLLNKHYAEVITSKKDGIASGLDITQTTNQITGVTRRTLYKILDDAQIEHDNQMQSFENDFDSRLAGMAFTRVGTFTAGATLTDMRQTLLWEVSQGGDGHEYGWTGSFLPSGKVVASGSTPATSGGIGAGAWIDRTDVTLRSEIGAITKTFSSVVEMISDASLTIGQKVKTLSYHSGLYVGGNDYIIVAGGTGISDGGTYINLSNGLQAKGLFINGFYSVCQFGAYGDGIHIDEDTAAFQAAASTGNTIMVPEPIAFYGINDSTVNKGILPANSGTKFICLGLAEIRLMSSRCNIFSNFIRDFSLANYGPITDFYCEGLYFNSNKDNLADPASASFPTGDNYSFGIYMVKCKNVELRRCKFANSWYGGHNLFSVLGQKVTACEYSNIGPTNAYYENYAAMGSDADYRALSGNVIYRDITVNDCGAVLRANGGINNGASGISKSWLTENLTASNCVTGIALYGSGYDDVLFKHIRFNNISKGRLISVSGEGATYSRATPVSNVRYEDIIAVDCLNDATRTNSAFFYINASGGVNSAVDISIIGGNSSGNANDLIVFGGEYTGSSTQAAGQFIVDKYKVKTAGTPLSHVRLNMASQISIKRVTHDALASVKMLNLAAGSDVDISDNDVIASGFVTSTYISRNWSKGSLRNIRGFKTYTAGLASVANNGTVAHGLVEAPPMINATMRQVGTPYIIGVTADATNIIFAITDNAGAVVTSNVTVAWEARCWHEIPI